MFRSWPASWLPTEKPRERILAGLDGHGISTVLKIEAAAAPDERKCIVPSAIELISFPRFCRL
jgi:hypothetical protein